jgi:hypothetical protein
MSVKARFYVANGDSHNREQAANAKIHGILLEATIHNTEGEGIDVDQRFLPRRFISLPFTPVVKRRRFLYLVIRRCADRFGSARDQCGIILHQ